MERIRDANLPTWVRKMAMTEDRIRAALEDKREDVVGGIKSSLETDLQSFDGFVDDVAQAVSDDLTDKAEKSGHVDQVTWPPRSSTN